MPAAVKLQEEYSDILQVVFVEVGNADAREMSQFAIDKKWFGGQAMWTMQRPLNVGEQVIPASACLAPMGSCSRRGSPIAITTPSWS